MAIFCSNCGKEMPDEANFCMKCGKHLQGVASAQLPRQQRWEYKDVVIPLNIFCFGGWTPKHLRRSDEIILPYIQHVATEGWQPEGPASAGELMARNQIAVVGVGTLKSATIRFKRLVPA